MASTLDIQTIVSEGLELGGNPGLATRATVFLKYLLAHLYRSQDWDFCKKTSRVLADAADYGKVSVAIPADYRAIVQLHIDGEVAPLTPMSMEELDVLRQNAADAAATPIATAPSHFAVAKESGATVIYLYPKPATRYTVNLRYYYIPDTTAYIGTTKPEYDDEASMVIAVANFAQKWDKEQLQELIAREARTMAASYRVNHQDTGRAGVTQLPMDERTFRTFRED